MKTKHLFAIIAVSGALFGFAQDTPYLPAGSVAPAFEGVAPDGKNYSLASATKSGSAFVVFWKQRCPHNPKASALFNSLSKAYGSKVNLLGVVNSDAAGAKAWSDMFTVNYPLLADPTKTAIGSYKLRYSITTVQVGSNGKIEKVFEGYGAEAMAALNAAMASASKSKPAELDLSGAPGRLTWG